ncbi:2-dehydro-3-deoxyphosphogluconate aldolase [Lysinibacillus sp. 2017]|uniref:bifunctional 4-hydroxy-2-oxoglutarate aldolase/2-dehydro-3-deoxy-phosphogluconate aldolase n=1 Tax=unclassified Lysinibacillus TaxID=2636778 RepID=UPI000D528432|nr:MULTISPECIES: bifunctional 4-hydroxy-2-oxoglutarate aldolase/2-dehydro-3-deoxy-phosphogluconate aldolase [unclassified Lysinibacillus]AWE07742.1 2-dehydro-3-deoxyphosphogluconate aldolase [Lysinibacillus sp. 2017]TGN32312.1 bifunctional 4-hydroxy-2-oxoglutarate aldolase/2-dehydro-3-deoxy-phosphogluconate aldolase [Lysinibacillus sp. S2017]
MSAIDQIIESGIVAVVRKIEPSKVYQTIDALIEGGVKAIEVTLDSENALEVINNVQKKYGNEIVIGAGTVLDPEGAYSAISNGAQFLFAPTLCEDTIRVAKRYNKIAIPGVFTPTEILKASEYGADIVKIFPGSVLGPQFIKDVRGPLGHIKMMPTGGITLENLGSFIKAGAVAVGVGGSLLDKKLIANEDWQGLANLAKAFVDEVKNSRNS